MNLKIIGSIILVVGVTIALLFASNMSTEEIGLKDEHLAAKSPEFLRCEGLIREIQDEMICEKKWALFKEQFDLCEKFAPTEPSEANFEVTTFRDIIFNIGECFGNEKKNEKAFEVYERGLKFEDWMQDDNFNTYSAHFLLRRAQDLVKPSKNPKCFSKNDFQKQIQKFSASGNPEDIHELLYSDSSLDTQVMASDAGGYLSYQQWKDVFQENKAQYKLKYLKETGENCFITTGWDEDYPWRGFCAEKVGDKGCFYLMTIYAGIEATLADFENFKKNEELK